MREFSTTRSRASRIADAPRDVVGIVVDIERDDDQPHPERGQVDRDPVDAVAQAHGDPVAGDEALAAKRRLPAAGERGDFGDGDVVPRVVDEVAVQRHAEAAPRAA